MANVHENTAYMPDDDEVMAHWPRFDTAEIARILGVTEAHVYNVMSRRKGKTVPSHYEKIFDRSPVIPAARKGDKR